MEMPTIGSIIKAQIKAVENACIILSTDGYDAFVDHTEFFWPPWPNVRLEDVFPIHAEIDIRVLGFLYQDRKILASIRRARPENNPYLSLSKMGPDTVFRARVDFVVPYPRHVSVTLEGGVPAHIDEFALLRNPLCEDLKVGDPLAVRIVSLDVYRPQLFVEPVRPADAVS